MSESSRDPNPLHLQFVAMLLHDLETPLAVAKQFLKRVAEGRYDPANPKHRKLAISSQLALHRGERILEDLLDQARAGTTSLTLNRTPTVLKELVSKCVSTVLPIADDKEITLAAKVDSRLAEPIELDAGLIERVIDNLLVNALRHAPRRTRIEIRAQALDGSLRVDVANTADSEFDAALERIFDPAYQVEMRYQRRMRGSGLGLSFCRLAVTTHGGTIGAHREEGNQVVFQFEIPINGLGGNHG